MGRFRAVLGIALGLCPWLTLLVLNGICASADDQVGLRRCVECRDAASRILRMPHLPQRRLGVERRVSSEVDLGGLQLTWFGLASEYGEMAQSTKDSVWVNHTSHRVILVDVARLPMLLDARVMKWDTLYAHAKECALWLADTEPGDWKIALTSVDEVDQRGIMGLRFEAIGGVGEMTATYPYSVSIGIAVDTGQVHKTLLTRDGLADAVQSLPTSQALARGLADAAGRLSRNPERLRWSDLRYQKRSAPGWSVAPCWQFSVFPSEVGSPPDGLSQVIVSVSGDEVRSIREVALGPDSSGMTDQGSRRAVRNRRTAEERGTELLRPTHEVDDRWPVWSADGESLFFLSQRPRPGAPWWRRVPSVVAVNLGNGLLECVHAPLEGTLRALSVAGSVIVANNANRHEAQIRNLRDGTYFAQGHYPDAHFDNPSVSADGGAIVYSADRRHGDTDIFVDDIKPDFDGLMGHRRLCKLEGTDHHPVFVGDGKRVCFAHVESGTHAAGETPPPPASSLYVVNAGAPYWENDPPVKVVEGFTRIRRLSTFLDGQRVLVADEAGLWIVDVETWAKTELNLPELHDPDLPDGPALKLRQPAVSPDGTRLVFSGYRDSGEDAEGTGWYIYVCDLDGSNLRRVTPLEDEPIPAYVFPETGKTAFDVAREIALERAERPE